MAVDSFINYLALEKKYSVHTTMAYRNDIEEFIAFLQSKYIDNQVVTIEKATFSDIRKWIVSLHNRSINFRSINRKISALKSFYTFLKKIGQIAVSPMDKGDFSLKTEKKIKLPFSENEIQKVLSDFDEDSFESLRNKAIIELFYATGIRRSELIELKISDLDLSSNQLKVLGKRNKERIVPILPPVKEILESYLKIRQEIDVKNSQNMLFLVKNGKKMYPTLVYRIIKSYFSAVTTKKDVSPHVLRHSFANHLLDKGADLNTIKELLGHSNLAATQVYTTSSLAELKNQYNKAHPRANENK